MMEKLNGVILKYMSVLSFVLMALGVADGIIYHYFGMNSYVFVVSLVVSICVFAVVIWRFSVALTRRIGTKVNSIDIINPNTDDVFLELAPLTDKLRQRNLEVSDRIKEMSVEHEAQDAMRRDFTANVSHELKTPLTSISGYAEIIKNGLVKPTDVERFAGKIYSESRRLVMLVGDIIKLSQLDSKEISAQFEKIDFYELCSAVISQLEIHAQNKNVTFELLGEHVEILSVEQLVNEIVYNLCDNAVKYNRDNGKVTVGIKRCVDGVELTVSDTGIGIPKDELDRVFERFYRVDKSHSKEIGGTGLGLSIVKHSVKYLGAEVSIESELGVGTTVRIVF